ncbi:MAG: hypothetical protein P1P83_03785 [Bacteroidales bacterium]|nr:hypothetical protein [Bacteroidales bacterium]MDT8372828.1 hypothetical protein [Bacteroidales bacterium]
METRRFNLDLTDNDSVSRILKSIFGIICIAVALILSLMIYRSGESTWSTWIAVAFLFLFGVWLVLKVTGLTDRYVTISESEIILKDKFYSPALVIRASDLEKTGFSQLKISFFLSAGKVIALRLGTYYRDNSFKLMEAVEEFCNLNRITTTGINSNEENNGL